MSIPIPAYTAPAELIACCAVFVLEHTNLLISLHEPSVMGMYIYAGPAFQTVLDYEPQRLIGQPSAALVHPDDLELVHEQLARLHIHNNTQATIRFRHADTTWRWFEIHWHRIVQDDHTYTIAISRDVTDYQQLEARLHQMQKLNSIGRLTAGVAHDFHNVMTGIDGCATLALAALPLHSEIRVDIEAIQHAATRANNLTDQLLGFARRATTRPVDMDVHDLIANLARLLRRIIGEDIELIISPKACHPHVRADPGQIEHVLMNLAVNARDAMPFGGQLIIETHNVPLRDVRDQAGAEAVAKHIVLTLRDTGIGMEPHILEHIFEPFFTTKQAGSGTGLGLAICDEIIGQYGGHITAVSEPGEGTTFTITLPQIIQLESVRRTAAEQAVELPGGSETILVVEDDQTVRTCIARLLRRQGYTTLTASDDAEALSVAHDHAQPIDLLLTDLVLPKISGKAVAEHLKALWPNLGVIILSGYPDAILANYGSFDTMRFVPKPCSLKLLANVVRTVLDSAKHATALTKEE